MIKRDMISRSLQLSRRILVASAVCLFSPAVTSAAVDLDGDGASEFWNLLYPEVLPTSDDSDNDGQSNRAEMLAGTDPTDAGDYFKIEEIRFSGDQIELSWEGVAGKKYEVQRWDDATGEWVNLLTKNRLEFSETVWAEIATVDQSGLFRVYAEDVDLDGDGLNAWEEALLGWDDDSGFSLGLEANPDYEEAIRALENGDGVTLSTGQAIPQRLPSEAEAARFLIQSSFGPTTESINEVVEQGLTGYLDNQMNVAPSLTRVGMWRTGLPLSSALWRHGWWRLALIAPDQLRQRMAYALSQIFVINTEPGTVIGDNIDTQAVYYDIFVKYGFDDFRKVLEDVTYSPAMGFYLSHLNNRKGDPAINRFPDENFAREIMQLFTIGLWKLNPDGTHQLDESGASIPTYDNSVITELAKVFTGMSHSTTNNGTPAESFYDTGQGNDYKFPMKVWNEEHESGPKFLFDDVVIPDGQSGEEDVQQTLDALSEHGNVAPFISYRLIQRFTTSNPSPAYLSRVTSCWNRCDGEMGQVLKAILLDPEVRGAGVDAEFYGKVREPVIRMIHIMRSFAPASNSGRFGAQSPVLKTEMGQYAMSSPTVFNFYLPEHSPRGELRESGLVAPELEIATTSSLLATHDRLKTTVSIGHYVRGVDYTEELALTDQPEELADHLDLLLTCGQMSPTLRAAVLDRINREPIQLEKVRAAVQVIVTSPEFSTLK